MAETEPRFDTATVRDLLAVIPREVARAIIDADVHVRFVSNTELAVTLTSRERSARKRVTEKFYVKIHRGDVPEHKRPKWVTPYTYNPTGPDL